MTVSLIQHSNLSTCVTAIRTCWDSHSKGGCYPTPTDNITDADIELIKRVILKHKHSSTAEHLVYTFAIDGVSRALLQELARHRLASPSVKSTRYTLKELKSELPITVNGDINWGLVEKYCVLTSNDTVNTAIANSLTQLQHNLVAGTGNDIAKYCLPEAYRTTVTWTINARSLQNFIKLRSSKDALAEITALAFELYSAIPTEHKFLFTDYLKAKDSHE